MSNTERIEKEAEGPWFPYISVITITYLVMIFQEHALIQSKKALHGLIHSIDLLVDMV